ncbi:MAG: hypothetical protein LBN12_07980 [Clostridiales Family XIII bacterium]|nr:hypothetical protein [Clostridiales Family XIII bacterium]
MRFVIAGAAPQSMGHGSLHGMTNVTSVIAGADPQSMDPGAAPGMTTLSPGMTDITKTRSALMRCASIFTLLKKERFR